MKKYDPEQLERLAQQIETHPALQAARENRLQEGDRMELVHLLMKYFRFEQQAVEQNLVSHEQALLTGKKTVFDSVAFMEAFAQSLAAYDPQRGSYLACFSFYYSRQRRKVQDEQYKITGRRSLSMGEKKARQIKKLLTVLHKTGQYKPEELPSGLYPVYARMMQMDPADFRELIALAIQEQMADNTACQDKEGNALPDLMDQQPDPAALTRLVAPERLDSLCALLELIADQEQKEYPRLFLTNLLVGLLKGEELMEQDRILCAKAMLSREELLWRSIFIQSYLDFVYDPEPVPNTVRNLVIGRLCRKPLNATVAEYKHVSAGAVSQNANRFWSRLRSRESERIRELLG